MKKEKKEKKEKQKVIDCGAHVTINFDCAMNARLAYYVRAVGVRLTCDRRMTTIEVINSRNTLTPGFIRIPLEDIPLVIDALTQLRARMVV